MNNNADIQLPPTPDPGLRVVAMRHSGLYREFFFRLAQLLKERHGSRVHLYCPRPEMVKDLHAQAPEGLFSSINFIEPAHPISLPSIEDEQAVIETARAYEHRYGRPYNLFAVTDRHFGRGFAPTGFHNPRSFQSENSDYTQYLEVYNQYFSYWENEFRSKKITLMLNPDWREASVARANGAQILMPSSIRHQNLHYWATDEFGNSDLIADAYSKAPETQADREIIEGPYVQGALRKRMYSYGRVGDLVKRLIRKTVISTRWRISGHSKAKLYLFTDEIKYLFRQWKTARQMQRNGMATIEDLEGKKFVYFPLQVDPETNFQGRSPEYFHQHAAIISIARELPAGHYLVIKEHFPALGLRPNNYYDQLRDLKNVILMDIRENGLEIIRRCSAVATINGSSGQEAAIMGVPVFAFGRHNLYNVLPHVYVVTDDAQLPGFFGEALAEDFDTAKARKAGAKFVLAMENISFDLEKFSHYAKNEFSNDALDAGYRRLQEALKTVTVKPNLPADQSL